MVREALFKPELYPRVSVENNLVAGRSGSMVEMRCLPTPLRAPMCQFQTISLPPSLFPVPSRTARTETDTPISPHFPLMHTLENKHHFLSKHGTVLTFFRPFSFPSPRHDQMTTCFFFFETNTSKSVSEKKVTLHFLGVQVALSARILQFVFSFERVTLPSDILRARHSVNT